MKSLVIVESPTKAKTLAKFLGRDYKIEASMGHVRDLPKSKLAVDVEHGFAPDYVVVAGREKTIADLKKFAKKAKYVILATDPDREGEAIAYHVKKLIGGGEKKFKRVVFHEITKSAVTHALESPGKINMNLVHAQQGRRVLDRLVGYKLSPLLWRKVRRGLSAGRVQSVVVKLIVEKEKEIEAFKRVEFWNIDVEVVKASRKAQALRDKQKVQEVQGVQKVSRGDGLFTVRLVKIDDKKAEVKNEKQADGVVSDLEKADYKVYRVDKKEATTSPPPPFMTSTLQRMAANTMGWSGRRTMRAAQRLYENGLITYHRTDSLNVAKEALVGVTSYIRDSWGEQYSLAKPRYFRSKSKSAQEAHEAIRPTKVKIAPKEVGAKIDKAEERLYGIIWKRFVASQMAKAVFDRTRLEVNAKPKKPNGKSREYLLSVTGRVMKFDGWTTVYSGMKSGKSNIEGDEKELPDVAENEELIKKKVMAEQKFTEPPARYNEASLIKALEERGIGRPSTYAPTISTIQTRQYVEKQERRFHPTSVGIAVTEFLTKYFDKVMDYDFTAGMENDLDGVAQGRKSWVEVMRKFYGPFEKKVESVGEKAKRVKVAVEKTGEKCPECKKSKERSKKPGDVVIRIGKFGKFLSCSKFPDCRYTAAYIEKVDGVKCPDDGGEVVIRKTRKGRKFFGCLNYPKCKWASWRKPK